MKVSEQEELLQVITSTCTADDVEGPQLLQSWVPVILFLVGDDHIIVSLQAAEQKQLTVFPAHT